MINNRCFSTDKFFTFTNILVASFFILGFIGIINHELWQDEMQAWMIAKDSSSIADLLKNLKYEGHTALWYLCLQLINRLTHNPLAMQIFHLIIATINVAIFVTLSPFNRLQKLLFTFGYFPFYEYSILSRNYNLGVLLIFSFCALFYFRRKSFLNGRSLADDGHLTILRKHQNPCPQPSTGSHSFLPLAIILALLAHTNIFGLILAIVLQLTLLLEIFLVPNSILERWDIASFLIVVISIIGAIIQLRPPTSGVQGNLIASDTTVWQTIFAQVSDLNRLMELISNVWKAYFPIHQFSYLTESITLIVLSIILFSIILSNSIERSAVKFLYLIITILLVIVLALGKSNQFPILEAINTPALLGSLVSLAILFFIGSWFVRQPAIFFLYSTGSLGIFLFTYLIYYSDNLRHTGHFFILFLLCLWLQSGSYTYPSTKPYTAAINQYKEVITTIFSIHLITGIIAYTNDLIRPFSMSKVTSSYIKNANLDTLPIMGVPDERVSAIPGYLNKKIYYPQSDRWGSFVIWDSQRRNITATEIIEPNKKRQLIKRNILKQVNQIVQHNPTDILLISTAPINFEIPNLKISPIKQFTANTIGREKSYRLYLIQKVNN